MKHVRWGDDDRYFGPFTYSYSKESRALAYMYYVPDELDYGDTPHNYVRLSGFRHTIIWRLPSLIAPHVEKVVASSWSADDIERMGRNWYFNVTGKSFGFTYEDNHLSVKYGVSTMDSSTDGSWGCFLPWAEWRHVRTSHYDESGDHVWTEPKAQKGEPWDWEKTFFRRKSLPHVDFEFDDFDGERITAKTRIGESEWRLGAGSFKWLSLFRKPRIKRGLDIEFSKETGPRKGSWKGGTVGHSIEMLPGELHEQAFRRYCKTHNMTFVRRSPVVVA